MSVCSYVSAKYIIDNNITIANLNIDRTRPEIEVIQITNTNEKYTNYASKEHTITIRINIIENNLQQVKLDDVYVDIKVGDSIINPEVYNVEKIQDTQNGVIYDLILRGITENGNLTLELKEGVAVNKSNIKNEVKIIDTGILIDNIAPKGIFTEVKTDGGKVNANIQLSEKIVKLEGWEFSNDKLNINKEFTNNVSYELPIKDYAGNSGIVEVNITQATNIKITYASHNSEVGWTFGYGNYDIAGKRAIKLNSALKTEAIAFNVEGNIDPDFVQVNSYMYTNWGFDSIARCTSTGILFSYAYNPSQTTYKSMLSNDLVTINGKKYFQLGGSGVNQYLNTDINGNNPITAETAVQYKYGISGIKMKLKDCSQFSIIYQVLECNQGWIEAKSNGQECTYKHRSPFSAFRMALVPKSEEQYVIDTWNKDIGTKKLDK